MGAARGAGRPRNPGGEAREFSDADGRTITRDVGYAIVHAAGARTIDEVVFAESGDLILLGARSLEGMNLRVDPRNKQLVAAGPIVAARAAQPCCPAANLRRSSSSQLMITV